MLESSKDLFYIALAFAAVWMAFFISWAIYYIVQIFKTASEMLNDVQERLKAIDRFIASATEKLEHTTTMLQVLVSGFEKVASFMGDRKAKRRKKVDEETTDEDA